jgi:hypothetical protein
MFQFPTPVSQTATREPVPRRARSASHGRLNREVAKSLARPKPKCLQAIAMRYGMLLPSMRYRVSSITSTIFRVHESGTEAKMNSANVPVGLRSWASNASARRYEAHFVAVRLPYGNQRDEEDAHRALQFIGPDEILTVDI